MKENYQLTSINSYGFVYLTLHTLDHGSVRTEGDALIFWVLVGVRKDCSFYIG